MIDLEFYKYYQMQQKIKKFMEETKSDYKATRCKTNGVIDAFVNRYEDMMRQEVIKLLNENIECAESHMDEILDTFCKTQEEHELCKKICQKYFYEGKTDRQIAEELGITMRKVNLRTSKFKEACKPALVINPKEESRTELKEQCRAFADASYNLRENLVEIANNQLEQDRIYYQIGGCKGISYDYTGATKPSYDKNAEARRRINMYQAADKLQQNNQTFVVVKDMEDFFKKIHPCLIPMVYIHYFEHVDFRHLSALLGINKDLISTIMYKYMLQYN